MSKTIRFSSDTPLTVADMNALLQDSQITDSAGDAQDMLISQKGITDSIVSIENSIASAVAERNQALSLKVDRTQIVQEKGNSELNLMSQKSVTNELAGKADQAAMNAALAGKVDKVSGRGLSETSVSQAEKNAWNNKSNFDGDYNSLRNCPQSLPANGGNANSIGGLTASAFTRCRLVGSTLYISTDGKVAP